MPQKPETVFKTRIRPYLERLPNSYVEKISQVSIRGTPDFLMCIGGRFVALELKKDKKESPDPLQKFKLKKIEAAGGLSFVVTPENWDKIFKKLKILAGGSRCDP